MERWSSRARQCFDLALPWLRKVWSGARAWQIKAARHAAVRVPFRLPASALASRTRQLSVEERLTLGPRQHLYLVRCGEARLLLASAGEAALQWIAMPEADAVPDEPEKLRTSANVRAPAPVAGKRAPQRRTTTKSPVKQESTR
jgi:flagellar biogenesis protein FliO